MRKNKTEKELKDNEAQSLEATKDSATIEASNIGEPSKEDIARENRKELIAYCSLLTDSEFKATLLMEILSLKEMVANVSKPNN